MLELEISSDDSYMVILISCIPFLFIKSVSEGNTLHYKSEHEIRYIVYARWFI